MEVAISRPAAGLLDRERIVASPGFNRWLVPPAALAIHLCIGMAYGFSVFWLPLSRALGVTQPIACSDLPLVPRHGIAGIPPLVERARQTAPHFQYLVNAIASECTTWPVQPAPTPSLHAQGAPPILVIGTRNDPATPYPWAQELARRLKPGVLLSAPGYSHTSFAMARAATGRVPVPAKTCVDDHVVRYLVDLQAPPNPTRCE